MNFLKLSKKIMNFCLILKNLLNSTTLYLYRL